MQQTKLLGNCPVCHHAIWKELYSVKDFNQDIAGEWDIVLCKKCGLGVLAPFPKPKTVSSFYDDSFYTNDKKRFVGFIEILRKFLAHNRYNIVQKYLPQNGKLLDFGSGPAHWGKMLKDKGWEVSNADISYSDDSELWMDGDRPVLNYPDDFFDVVTMWYVIEHLLNPREALREIKRVLKPNGILITSQQNFSSLQAKLFGARWLILDPPRHIFQFTTENLQDLASQEGYQMLGIDHRSIELGPFTIMQSLLNFIFGNENYLFRFLKNKKLSTAAISTKKVLKIKILGGLSAFLGIVLAPLSVGLYYILQAFGSGDTFTLFLRKGDNSRGSLVDSERKD